MKKLHGVTIAMVTPMDEGGAVNYTELGKLTDFLIARGVDCLYPCGTTGEMFHLSVEERKKIAKTVVARANKRVTVYIHVGAMAQEDTIALAHHAYEIGADGVGVVTPAYFGVTNAEMENYYITVAKAIPDSFPLYLYNIPQCAANDLSLASVNRIAAACSNVIGIKYSFADMLRTQDYLYAKEGFSVLHGSDRLLLAVLAMGCDGVVTGVGCVYPEPFVALLKAWNEGSIEEARRLQKITSVLAQTMHCGTNMAYFKEALQLRGIGGNHMRAPQMDLAEADLAGYLQELRTAEAMLPEGMLIK